MDPLTLAALIGGVWLFTRHRAPAVAPAMAPPGGAFTPTYASPILYTGSLPPARGGSEDVTASPIEQSGYIPPYVSDPGSSPVTLQLDWGQHGAQGATMNGLGACGCGCGMGDARGDARGLSAQLRALRSSFHSRRRAAIDARQFGQLEALTQDFRAQLRSLISAYQAAHPEVYPMRMAKAVAPQFVR